MSVKIIAIFSFFFLHIINANSQDSCIIKKCREISEIIEREISINPEKYSTKLSEFFIIDIKLKDSLGGISNIDFFKKNKSVHFKSVENAILKIKKKWRPISCSVKRILIPLFIYFDQPKEFDLPIFIKPDESTGLYICRIINIAVTERIK